ncbi:MULTISPECIES: hypothetical protein [unclassified Mameliella]|uniref:hypothetical protein n=1 Tax=unclassified Mameliella TaxID=2630630 RepID=UPI00273F3CD9|nr:MULTISPECIES: hypothetical protein [unclassified Mameliella]
MITLLTMHELQGFTDQELDALHELYLTLLMETDPDTPDRRNILASLENIERMRGQRSKPRAKPPCGV